MDTKCIESSTVKTTNQITNSTCHQSVLKLWKHSSRAAVELLIILNPH